MISSKDIYEEREMHSKCDNIDVMTYDDPEKEIIEELFESLLSRNQIDLKTQVRGQWFYLSLC